MTYSSNSSTLEPASADESESLSGLPALDQADLQLLSDDGLIATPEDWICLQQAVDRWCAMHTDVGDRQALQILDRMLNIIATQGQNLKELSDVDVFVRERLECMVFDIETLSSERSTAAFLFGHSLALSERTSETIPAICKRLWSGKGVAGTTHEDIEPTQHDTPSTLVLNLLLGANQANPAVFESNVAIALQHVQIIAFASLTDTDIAKEALLAAMRAYGACEKPMLLQHILETISAFKSAALKLCEVASTMRQGVTWTCFIAEHAPMSLRFDLIATCGETERCTGLGIFSVLSRCLACADDAIQTAICRAVPILITWDTDEEQADTIVFASVQLMLRMAPDRIVDVMNGLGGLASVVLHRFEPYIEDSGNVALNVLRSSPSSESCQGAQNLLRQLVTATGPLALDIAMQYLHLDDSILLADVGLLETIGTMFPDLSTRINYLLGQIIDSLARDTRIAGEDGPLVNDLSPEYQAGADKQEAVLRAINAFSLRDAQLAAKAQKLVLLSLDESNSKSSVLAALDIATSASIATRDSLHKLTIKTSQLLLSEDPHIVHVALSVLSNPALASSLDDKSCSMILLALHQSLEPSIQIVAAKLLAHLSSVHRAIVQPLAWRHIRQSLGLMDFLKSVDPNRAVVEACIVSNLLPALPAALHRKYVDPVKSLILQGLQNPTEGTTLSLIFQGLANLAKFEGWNGPQQSMLAMDLLELSQEIPRDSKHAALNAISRLLAVPQKGVDVYEMLVNVHANFGVDLRPDEDLRAMISGIYGSLGTIERNPTISRDSRAAIDRETTFYDARTKFLAQIADTRDRCGVSSQSHTNSVVSQTLLGTEQLVHRSLDERYLRLEILSGLGISQPHSMSSLAPELPTLVMRELRRAIDPTVDPKHAPYTPLLLILLSSMLHVSNSWREKHYPAVADILSKGINAGQAPAALKGLEVVLDALE